MYYWRWSKTNEKLRQLEAQGNLTFNSRPTNEHDDGLTNQLYCILRDRLKERDI